MCLLIEQPKGLTFSRAALLDFLHHNPDGFGAMWGDGQTLHIVKALADADALAIYLDRAAGRHAVLHYRMATHGPVTLDNAHPYLLTPRIAVAHNGVLSCGNDLAPDRSDSWVFADRILRPIAQQTPDVLFTDEFAAMLGKMIGSGNRLAFAHADGRVQLVNASAGVVYKGAWFSNLYAWTPPVALRPVYARAAYDWAADGDRWTGQRAAARLTGASSASRPVDTGTLSDARPYSADAWKEMRSACREEGLDGVAQWIDENPVDAAAVLIDWLPVDADAAAEMVDADPYAAAAYVCDSLAREDDEQPELSGDPGDALAVPF